MLYLTVRCTMESPAPTDHMWMHQVNNLTSTNSTMVRRRVGAVHVEDQGLEM